MDNDDSPLQQLLRCKRYEQPPPGYFVSFSDKVLMRIESEEATEYSSWWNWLVARFDAKPVLVCAYSLAVSSLLFLGFRISQAFEAEMTAAPGFSGPWLAVTPASPILISPEVSQVAYTEVGASPWASLRPAFHEEPNHLLFPRASVRFQPAGFVP